MTILIPRNKPGKAPLGNHVDDLGKIYAASQSVSDLMEDEEQKQKATLLAKSGTKAGAAGATGHQQGKRAAGKGDSGGGNQGRGDANTGISGTNNIGSNGPGGSPSPPRKLNSAEGKVLRQKGKSADKLEVRG